MSLSPELTSCSSSQLLPPPSETWSAPPMEEEPLLKYERLSSDLKHILAESEALRLCVHSKLLVLATRDGAVHVLDAFGHAMSQRRVEGHVLELDVDHDGEALLVVTHKQIVVMGIADNDLNQTYVLPDLVSGSIDPIYSRPSTGRRFMSLDRRCSLLLHERGLFNRLRSVSISPSIDVINDCNDNSLKWRGRFAAWVVRSGVRVFDVLDESIISLVKVEVRGGQRSMTRIAWVDQFNFVVSADDVIKLCRISKRAGETHSTTSGSSRLPSFKVTITRSCTLTNRIVCGVAAFKHVVDKKDEEESSDGDKEDPEVVALTLLTDDSEDKRPHLMVLKMKRDGTYIELADDVLSVHSHEKCHVSQFRLESLPNERLYFVVSPKDVVLARTLDLDDRLSFLTSNGRVLEAFNIAEKSERQLRSHNIVDLGHLCVDVLLEENKVEEAASLCRRFCSLRNLSDNWQRVVFKFARVGRLKALANIIPTEFNTNVTPTASKSSIKGSSVSSTARLETQLYEMILFDFLKTDPRGMLDLIKKWPTHLYNSSAMTKAVVEQLLVMGEDSSSESRWESDLEALQSVLAILFMQQNKFDKALAIYLKLSLAEEAFSLLRLHPRALLKADTGGVNAVTQLIEMDPKKASQVLLELRPSIASEFVIEALQDGNALFHYLDALINTSRSEDAEESFKYHNKFVELLALFDPDRLLAFLRSSDHYSMELALRLCERHEFTHERVFLLARMGATRQALKLITHQLTDIQMAVEFCKQHPEEPELWTDLINYALNKPYFVTVLLRQIGTHLMDPRTMLIAKIPENMAIPGLRDSLAQIMHDFRLQLSLQQGCQRIIDADCNELMKQRLSNRAMRIGNTHCHICNRPLVSEDGGDVFMDKASGLAIHSQCIEKDDGKALGIESSNTDLRQFIR